MSNNKAWLQADRDPLETQEWEASLQALLDHQGPDRAYEMLAKLQKKAEAGGLNEPYYLDAPYLNTPVPAKAYPGDLATEKKVRQAIRWNMLMMVLKAGKVDSALGGHLSTPASIMGLYEVGFHHFFKGPSAPGGADLIFFQGHSSPAIYARSFLEGRLQESHLERFRQETAGEGGLSSYPHPYLMPEYWQFPTVSLGLNGVQAIYQARLLKYLDNRGLAPLGDRKVWSFHGDGEMDEHQNLGPLWVAGREKLDNLIYVVNCNLQRLDGPVMGNDKVVSRLEGLFKGAGWRVIKLLWSSAWEELLQNDTEGHLTRALTEATDGEIQNFRALGPDYMREHFFAKSPQLAKMIEGRSDEFLQSLKRGGHDEQKVFEVYSEAMQTQGAPTVILVQTVKGYGVPSLAAMNTAHSNKKIAEDELLTLRDNYQIPLTDEQVKAMEFYHPGKDSEVAAYLKDKRESLGGYLPTRTPKGPKLPSVPDSVYEPLMRGSERAISTTMYFVRTLTALLRVPEIKPHLVPIVADEARTFGMEGLFSQIKIYAHDGQKYTPHDKGQLLSYSEAKDGQLLQEGITEDGGVASWMAAGSSAEVNGVPLVPFYIYYSMFGFQRVGDSLWAAGDLGVRGFLLGATAGRTTLAGEGLQHDDGHNIYIAASNPACRAYDPAYGYEVVALMKHGLEQMYHKQEQCFYYLNLYNESHAHAEPPKIKDLETQIAKGMYLYQGAKSPQFHLLSSGSIFKEAEQALKLLEEFGVSANLFSATSFTELAREGASVERESLRNPESKPQTPYIQSCLGEAQLPVLVATDYIRGYVAQVAPYVQNPMTILGTDGFGRSDSRAALRAHFEVDAAHIAYYALAMLVSKGKLPKETLAKAAKRLNIQPDKPYSLHA